MSKTHQNTTFLGAEAIPVFLFVFCVASWLSCPHHFKDNDLNRLSSPQAPLPDVKPVGLVSQKGFLALRTPDVLGAKEGHRK